MRRTSTRRGSMMDEFVGGSKWSDVPTEYREGPGPGFKIT
jgi:hypothetical protein